MNLRRCLIFAVALVPVVLAISHRGLWAAEAPPWLFPDIRVRVPITVKAGIYPRTDALVRWEVDFAPLLRSAGVTGTFDAGSIRVASDDAGGAAKEIPSRFFPSEGAAGELVWLMAGEVEPLESRSYRVYFDVAGPTPRPPPSYPPIPGADARPENLVRNPGFEEADPKDGTQAAGWGRYEGSSNSRKSQGTIAIVHDPVRSGKNALKLHCTEGYSFGCRQEKIPLKPNTLYRLGVWARSDPANGPEERRMYISAALYQANGRPVATPGTRFDVSGAPPPDAWIRLSKRGLFPYRSDVKTPPDTAYCSININLSGDPQKGGTAVGIVYLDDVELVEVRPEDRVPPVAVEAGPVEKADGGQRSQP